MQNPYEGYAAIAIRMAGKEYEMLSLLCDVNNKIVVFDNLEVARNVLPALRSGVPVWVDNSESVYWTDHGGVIPTSGLVCASIIWPYPIYDLPPNHPKPSETKQRDWKYHIIWTEFVSNEELRGMVCT